MKMHGAHNTFVLVDERPARCADYNGLARTLCARDGPVDGADGILVVLEAREASVAMRIFNADGSEAEMCGNGIRCIARYLFERGEGDAFTIATGSGRIGATVTARAPFAATVDMGPVHFPHGVEEEALEVSGTTWRLYEVSLGNLHAVALVDDVDTVDLLALGKALQTHGRFRTGTNVHLAAALDTRTLNVRHFERGVGLTQACGTGAVAVAAVAIAARGFPSPLDVRVPGGTLAVAWQPGGHAQLTGGAEFVLEREVEL
ncbi:MAG: diaminopimelate epimerase [Candidatus Eremiobacteraeota bacterium]|nr:diaminopimelate epimerase [Candidatus Eremiobacteraeota bacterium]MBC5802557.1 diaminopimelate epimerase [Candidatus Eremiobacteraeota bacterium]